MKVSTIVLALNALDHQLKQSVKDEDEGTLGKYTGMMWMLDIILQNEFRSRKYTVSEKGQKHVITKVK